MFGKQFRDVKEMDGPVILRPNNSYQGLIGALAASGEPGSALIHLSEDMPAKEISNNRSIITIGGEAVAASEEGAVRVVVGGGDGGFQ